MESVARTLATGRDALVVRITGEGLSTGNCFKEHGVQITVGVPLHCDEPESFST